MPKVMTLRQPSRFRDRPRMAMVPISATWPMLMATMMRFSCMPSAARKGLVQKK
jgi:hypothetical protein